MKKILLVSTFLFSSFIHSFAQSPAPVKVKDLPTTSSGTTGDFILKDRADGSKTEKIAISNFISTYSFVVGTPPPSGWSLTGNAGTTAGTNFIGTTDNVDFMIKRNNSPYVRLDSNAFFIGNHAGAGSFNHAQTKHLIGIGNYSMYNDAPPFNEYSIGIGDYTLYQNKSTYNIAIGWLSMDSIKTGSNGNANLGTWGFRNMRQGQSNTNSGNFAFQQLRYGNENTNSGYMGFVTSDSIYQCTNAGNHGMWNLLQGSGNTGLGYFNGADLQYGDNNLFLGAYSGAGWLGSNRGFIGNPINDSIMTFDFLGNRINANASFYQKGYNWETHSFLHNDSIIGGGLPAVIYSCPDNNGKFAKIELSGQYGAVITSNGGGADAVTLNGGSAVNINSTLLTTILSPKAYAGEKKSNAGYSQELDSLSHTDTSGGAWSTTFYNFSSTKTSNITLSESIRMTAPYEGINIHASSRNDTISSNVISIVGNDFTTNIGGNEIDTCGSQANKYVGGSYTLVTGGDFIDTIGNRRKTFIGGNRNEVITGGDTLIVSGKKLIQVNGVQYTEMGGATKVNSFPIIYNYATNNINIVTNQQNLSSDSRTYSNFKYEIDTTLRNDSIFGVDSLWVGNARVTQALNIVNKTLNNYTDSVGTDYRLYTNSKYYRKINGASSDSLMYGNNQYIGQFDVRNVQLGDSTSIGQDEVITIGRDFNSKITRNRHDTVRNGNDTSIVFNGAYYKYSEGNMDFGTGGNFTINGGTGGDVSIYSQQGLYESAVGDYGLTVTGGKSELLGSDNIIVVSGKENITADSLNLYGKIRIKDGTQGNGKVLTSNSDGLASWASEGQLLHTISTPTTAATVTLINNYINIINPSGTIAALTINFPNSPSNNDFIEVTFDQIVTSVTYVAGTGGATIKGQINGVVGGQKRWDYDSGTNTWY